MVTYQWQLCLKLFKITIFEEIIHIFQHLGETTRQQPTTIVNIDRSSINHFTASYIQPDASFTKMAATDDATSINTVYSFIRCFSYLEFLNDMWVPKKMNRKRKRCSTSEYSPADQCSSMFYQNYIQPAKNNICIEDSIRNENSKKGKRFWRRLCLPYCMFEEMCTSMIEEGYYYRGICANLSEFSFI